MHRHALLMLLALAVLGLGCSQPVQPPLQEPTPNLEATVAAMVATQVPGIVRDSPLNEATEILETLYPNRSSVRPGDQETEGPFFFHEGVTMTLDVGSQKDSTIEMFGYPLSELEQAIKDGKVSFPEAPEGKAFFSLTLTIRNESDHVLRGSFWPFVPLELETPFGTVEGIHGVSGYGWLHLVSGDSQELYWGRTQFIEELYPHESVTTKVNVLALNERGMYYVMVGSISRVLDPDNRENLPINQRLRWVWGFKHDGLLD